MPINPPADEEAATLVRAATVAGDDAETDTHLKPLNSDPQVLEYGIALLDATREELVRADSKAALLLAGAGVGVSALLNGLMSGRWTPTVLDNRVEWLWARNCECVHCDTRPRLCRLSEIASARSEAVGSGILR